MLPSALSEPLRVHLAGGETVASAGFAGTARFNSAAERPVQAAGISRPRCPPTHLWKYPICGFGSLWKSVCGASRIWARKTRFHGNHATCHAESRSGGGNFQGRELPHVAPFLCDPFAGKRLRYSDGSGVAPAPKVCTPRIFILLCTTRGGGGGSARCNNSSPFFKMKSLLNSAGGGDSKA